LPRGAEWLLLLGVGVFAQLGQVQLTEALRLEPAGRVSSVNYVQVLFAYGFGVLIFGEIPTLLGVAGAALIVAGTLAVARRKPSPPLGAGRDALVVAAEVGEPAGAVEPHEPPRP